MLCKDRTSLCDLTDQMYDLIEHGSTTFVTYLDLAKAFDTINHSLLCQELQEIGLAEARVKSYHTYHTMQMGLHQTLPP